MAGLLGCGGRPTNGDGLIIAYGRFTRLKGLATKWSGPDLQNTAFWYCKRWVHSAIGAGTSNQGLYANHWFRYWKWWIHSAIRAGPKIVRPLSAVQCFLLLQTAGLLSYRGSPPKRSGLYHQHAAFRYIANAGSLGYRGKPPTQYGPKLTLLFAIANYGLFI